MVELKRIEFEDYSCRCCDRSWSFPATVSVVIEEGAVLAHWQDGVGWSPCDQSEEGHLQPLSALGELNHRMPTFEAWQAVRQHAVAEANWHPIEHWRQLWLQSLDRQLSRARKRLELAERIVANERNRLLDAERRAVVGRVGSPDLAAAAQRLLAEGWAGTPADLLATAEAVLGRPSVHDREPDLRAGEQGAAC